MQNTLTKEDMNKCGIYSITNLVNGKRYIGQTNNFRVRCKDHRHKLKFNEDSIHLQCSVNKYGTDKFIFETVNICDLENLDEMEIHFIRSFNTLDRRYGYNLDSGGNSNKTVSEETRQKQSLAKKNKPITEEHKRNVSVGLYEMNERMRKLGITHWATKKHTKEHNERIRLGLVKKQRQVNQLDKDGNFIKRFDSIISASKEVNKNNTESGRVAIIHVCKGKCKSAYGFKWSYVNVDVKSPEAVVPLG